MKTLTLNDELTAINEEARKARTLANISRRARTLFTEGGYQVRSYGENIHIVESPAGDRYTVWHGVETGFSCSCPCFAELGTCKHLEAVDLMKQDDEADAAFEKITAAGEFFGYSRYEF